jgi:uncharacterized protein (TIRG00374 family)
MHGHPGFQIRQFWRLATKLLVTGGIVWYLLTKVPLVGVGHALRGAALRWIVAGFVLQLIVRIVNAVRIRIIARAQGAPLSFRAILSALFTTVLYGLLLPGSIGAGAATLVKYVGHGATLAAALASMAVNRLLDTLTVVSLAAFFWGLEHHSGTAVLTVRIATVCLIAAPVLLIGGHLLLFGRVRLLTQLAHLVRRFRSDHKHALLRGLTSVVEQCAHAGNLTAPPAMGVFSLSVLKELLAATIAYCFAHAVGVDLPFITVAWMQGAVALLILLPITVSGLGVREGALVLVSRPYGVGAVHALTWGLVQFGALLCIALIGGLIELRALWLSPAQST